MDYGLISFLESKDDFKQLNVGDIVLYCPGDNWYSAKVDGRGEILGTQTILLTPTDRRIQKVLVETNYRNSDLYRVSPDLFELAHNEREFIRTMFISETPMFKRHNVDMIMGDLDIIVQNYRKPRK